jgi:hypothetical protein
MANGEQRITWGRLRYSLLAIRYSPCYFAPDMRKAIGSVAILVFITVYIVAVLAVSERVLDPDSPWWLQLLFFGVAGTAWALPLKPLFAWMNKVNKE